jgi:hypothetical protein
LPGHRRTAVSAGPRPCRPDRGRRASAPRLEAAVDASRSDRSRGATPPSAAGGCSRAGETGAAYDGPRLARAKWARTPGFVRNLRGFAAPAGGWTGCMGYLPEQWGVPYRWWSWGGPRLPAVRVRIVSSAATPDASARARGPPRHRPGVHVRPRRPGPAGSARRPRPCVPRRRGVPSGDRP